MEDIIKNDNEYKKEDFFIIEEKESAGEDVKLYLLFQLGKEQFGIPVSEIREVIECRQIHKIPRVPDYLKGILNLRGEVVPIIDLHSRFYNSISEITRTSSIVVVEIEDDNLKIPIGVIIDSVKAVSELHQKNVELLILK